MYVYLVSIFLSLMLHASAQANTERLPVIKRHSTTLINARRGQAVLLKLEASNFNQIFWYDREEKICEGATCKVMTGKLTQDFSTIGVVVINQYGSQFVEYKINLKNPSKKQKENSTVVPPMVAYDSKDLLPGEFDHFVRASRGWGVSYQVSSGYTPSSKLDVIKSEPRHLKWFERLKASSGDLYFGKKLEFEGRLLVGSSARLVKDDNKARIVMLEHGVFRAKALTGTKLANVVIVGDWLQIDLGKGADIVVSYAKGSEKVKLEVLQGHVESRRRSPIERPDPFGELSASERKEEANDLGKALKNRSVYQAGYAYTISQNLSIDSKPELINGRIVQSAFRESVVKIERKLKALKAKKLGLGKNSEGKLISSKPFIKIKQMIERKEYADALDKLATADTKSAQDDLIWVALVGASSALILPKTQISDNALQLASQIWSGDEDLLFKLAQHQINIGSIAASDGSMLAAEDIGLDGSAFSKYYLGLTHFRGKSFKKSVKYLRAVERSAEDEKLYESAHTWRRLAEQSVDWYALANIAGVYDSNVLRVKDKNSFTGSLANLKNSSSMAVSGETKLYKAFFKGAILSPFVAFDASKLAHAKDFSVADYVYERISFGLDTSLWGIVWGNKVYAETHIFSEDRSFDGAGFQSKFHLPQATSKLSLSFDLATYRDPIPGSYNLKDPIGQQLLNSIADLSSSHQTASLGGYVHVSRNWSLYALVSYQKRDFANIYTNVGSYKVPSIALSNEFNGMFQETWKFDLSYHQFDFFNRGPDNIDNRYRANLSMLLDLDRNFSFFFKNSFENQASSLISRNYDKYTSQLGLELAL